MNRVSPRTVLAIAGAGGVATSAVLALRLLTSSVHARAIDDRPDNGSDDDGAA